MPVSTPFKVETRAFKSPQGTGQATEQAGPPVSRFRIRPADDITTSRAGSRIEPSNGTRGLIEPLSTCPCRSPESARCGLGAKRLFEARARLAHLDHRVADLQVADGLARLVAEEGDPRIKLTGTIPYQGGGGSPR